MKSHGYDEGDCAELLVRNVPLCCLHGASVRVCEVVSLFVFSRPRNGMVPIDHAAAQGRAQSLILCLRNSTETEGTAGR